MTKICHLPHRSLIKIIGPDSFKFLNGLVTANIEIRPKNQLIYGAFLKPQGKIITDCLFWTRSSNEVWIDVAEDQSASLLKSLTLYKLRANVSILCDETKVFAVLDPNDSIDYLRDPRAQILNSGTFGRRYIDNETTCDFTHWVGFRYENCIFESGFDADANTLYASDANLDLLDGIDFHKGCYVGQELTSRMKRRGQIKNRILSLRSTQTLSDNAAIVQNDQAIGNVIKSQANTGLGLVRIDRYDRSVKAYCNDQELDIVFQPWQLP